MAKSRKPAPVVVEPYRARAIRGPHKDGSGRWYWRAELYKGQRGAAVTLWTGWGQRDEVAERLRTLDPSAPADVAGTVDPSVRTVRDLLEVWIAAQQSRRDVSPSWLRATRNSGKQLAEVLGDTPLDGFARSRDMLDRYRDRMLGQGWASGTVKQHLKMLRAAWLWGQEVGVCPDRTLPRARVKVVPVRDKHTPSPEDVQGVLARLKPGWPRLLGILCFATGARIGELCRLRWEDLDLDAGVLRIRQGKTGARDVPLPAPVVAELRSAPRTVTGRVLSVSSWTGQKHFGPRHLDPACEAAGVQRFTPYAFRRFAVRAYCNAKVDPGIWSTILGHSPATAWKYYLEVDRSQQQAALAQSGLGTVIPFPAPVADPHNNPHNATG